MTRLAEVGTVTVEYRILVQQNGDPLDLTTDQCNRILAIVIDGEA